MTRQNISMENGVYNRYEILDKIDVIHKLNGVANKIFYIDSDMYQRVCKEIRVTSKSTAKLFLFDNKHYKVCSFSIILYDKLYALLNDNMPMNISTSYNAKTESNE